MLRYFISQGFHVFGSVRSRKDAQKIDFDDSLIYSEINKDKNDRKIKMTQMHRDQALEAFKIWKEKEDKIKY